MCAEGCASCVLRDLLSFVRGMRGTRRRGCIRADERGVAGQVNNYENDPFIGTRAVSEALPAGFEAEVPRARAVFTSLNHPRKIKPQRFKSFVAILAAVDNSSLSLLSR